MSNIDAQIKALLLKKKKIEYVQYVLDLIKNDTKCIDFKDVQKEIVQKIEPFLIGLQGSIETDGDLIVQKSQTKADNNTPFSQEEPQTNPKPQAPKKDQSISNSDKMNFAMGNRHLANKRVQILNDQNAQIFGTVVGLDAPFVIIKTETGPTIQVPLEKVVPQ